MEMKSYQSKMPSCIFAGECLDKIGEIIAKENAKNVVLFTDKGIEAAGLDAPVRARIEAAGAGYTVIDDIPPEPAYTAVEAVIERTPKDKAELIIAVGGGSVMDSAKLCSLLLGSQTTVRDLLKNPLAAKKQVKSVMIPTTCGTGSEATCNAIVAVPEEEVKVGIVNDEMIPDYVILDASMIAKLPKKIIAATGVDALAHAVECYTSKKANPLSDAYALYAAKLIFGNIRRAYADADDMEAKQKMLIGAFFGGAAITSSGTTAVHALSYPLGGKYHIPHGVSNAILFKHVMEFNLDACEERLAGLCDLIAPELAGKSVRERAEHTIAEIADIVRFTEIPTDLGEYGVKPSDMDFLVEAAYGVRRLLDNNMKDMTREDIRGVYQKVMA